jgi:hypothetical protein
MQTDQFEKQGAKFLPIFKPIIAKTVAKLTE